MTVGIIIAGIFAIFIIYSIIDSIKIRIEDNKLPDACRDSNSDGSLGLIIGLIIFLFIIAAFVISSFS